MEVYNGMTERSTGTKNRVRGNPGEPQHFDHDVERRLLSCLLLDPSQYARVLALGLRTDHFHYLAHREVYQAAGALWETTGFFDGVTLTSFLDEQGTLDVVKIDYLGEILVAAATASSAPHYAEIILRHAERREIVESAQAVLEASRNGAANSDIVLDATTRFTTIQQQYANRVRPVNAAEYLTHTAPDVNPIIPGLLDKGDRHFIVSQSKAGKSWFALQQALCIASGLPFLEWGDEWDAVEPKRVAVCQFELKEAQYHKRVRRLAAALDITPDDLGGRLDIFNLRGASFDIFDVAPGYDVIYLDPLYVMLTQAGADENKSTDVAKVLTRISAWQRQTEAAVVIVHHGTKGRIADRQVIDRGAGSGAIGRDMDGMLSLAPARDDPDCLVVDHVARNHRPTDPFVIQFADGHFQVRAGVAAVAETSATANGKAKSGPTIAEAVEAIGKTITAPRGVTEVRDEINEEFGFGRDKTTKVVSALCERGFEKWKSKEQNGPWMIGPVRDGPPEEN